MSSFFPYDYCICLDVVIVSQSLPIPSGNKNLSNDKIEVIDLAYTVVKCDDGREMSVQYSHRSIVKPKSIPFTPLVAQDTGISVEEMERDGVDFLTALGELKKYREMHIPSDKSICMLTYGRWDLPITLHNAVMEATGGTEALPAFLYNFYDVRDLFFWGHHLLTPFVKPKSASIQSICESFRVEKVLSHPTDAIQYTSVLADIISNITRSISDLKMSGNWHELLSPESFIFPSALNWLDMLRSFRERKETLVKVVDLPYTATHSDVREWLLLMSIEVEPVLCRREIHPERLRPSGTAFIQFEKHEDALRLMTAKGIKISGRMPFIISTSFEEYKKSPTMPFPPNLSEFQMSRGCMVRLGSLFWNTAYHDIMTWCYAITDSSPVGAWIASLSDGRSTGVGWVKFADSNAAYKLLELGLENKLPPMYNRSIIVDPSDDAEIEFAESIAVVTPFPDWVYIPVPLSAVGTVIGKGGQRIAQLGKKWKVKITAPRRGENPIFTLFGIPQRITGAKQEIESIVQQYLKDAASHIEGPGGGPYGGMQPNYSPHLMPFTNTIFGFQSPGFNPFYGGSPMSLPPTAGAYGSISHMEPLPPAQGVVDGSRPQGVSLYTASGVPGAEGKK